MTSVGEAVDRCYRTWLYGTYERDRNELAAALGPNDTTLTLTYSKSGAAKGGLISIGTELLAVIDSSSDHKTLHVIRGVDGTTSAAYGAHRAVEINPRYARGTIIDEMYWELQSWPEDIYATRTARVSVDSGLAAFEVIVPSSPRIRRILDVQRPARAGVLGAGNAFADQRGFRIPYRRAYDVNTDGDAWVYLDERSVGTDYRVIVAVDWPVTRAQWEEDLDLNADVGLSEGMIDALVLGATWRAVFAKEGRKLQLEAQGQSRDSQEIPAGAFANFGLRLLTLRDRRLNDEAKRLVSRWGFG